MKSRIPLLGAAALLGCFISVAEAQPPQILAQPTNEVLLAGAAAAFAVAVTGAGPLTYQWQCNGTNLLNRLITTVAANGRQGYSGDGGAATDAQFRDPVGVALDASGNLFIADEGGVIREVVFPGPTLVLKNAGGANAGAYDVVVSRPYGSVTSSVVTLALALNPLNALVVGGQEVQLQFQGVPGISYLLLSATDLNPPVDWRPVITNVASSNGIWAFTDTNVPSSNTRLYRMSTTGQ
jgi:hypothetical protein